MTNEDLLYRYFSDSLTESERLIFNQKMEADSGFRADFEFENNLKQAIKHEHTSRLKERLRIFETELTEDKSENTNPKFNWRIAASVVLFLGASWFGYISIFGVNYENLYETNFSNYPNTEFTITRSDTVNSFERKAFVAYEAGDFNKAISVFNTIPEASQKPYHSFYTGQAYLEIHDFKKAKAMFDKTVANNNGFVAESHWYLALIAVNEKDKTEAIRQLKILIRSFNYNKSKAEALLNKLD